LELGPTGAVNGANFRWRSEKREREQREMSLSGKKAELRDLYDRFAAHQRRRAAPKRFYHRYVEKLVHRLVPEPRRVLDIGCGNGDVLASLSPRRGLGVDFSGGMVALAAERHAGLEFRQCDAETLELDEKFDTVLMVNLLGHLDDIYAALQKTRGAMDARGRLVVVYYNHLWEPLLRLASLFRQRAPIPHENWLPLPEIENLLKLTDYEVVRSGRRMLCPAPIPGLAWVLNTAIAPLPLVNAFSLIQ